MRGDSARPGKRPLRALSASEKMDAIQRVHEGESKASVARDIGVPESTLRGWCKSEHKIRGMARNSSTPDSEVHSPASSSGTNNLNSIGAPAGGSANVSSEDESPCTKKPKFDQQTSIASTTSSAYLTNDGCLDGTTDGVKQSQQQDNKPKIDYVGLMTSMANMRPENGTLLLQQLGLLSGATGTSLAKNIFGMTAASLSHGSTVGLVENGLQYTKSTANVLAGCNGSGTSGGGGGGGVVSGGGAAIGGGGSGNGNNGSGKRHSLSAIAPAQMDSVAKSCTRKILPPAAEAPSTPVPASPRKTNDNGSGSSGIGSTGSLQRAKAKRENGTGSMSTANNNNKKVDEALWLWLTQQQQLLGQQSASFNPSINQQDGSWFWQWYKQCSFPLLAATQTAATATPSPISVSPVAKKSPSKAKALLDNVLCNNNNNNNNNNNENAKRSFNLDDEEEIESATADVPRSTEEAIEHGEKFFKWLDKCSEPSVTRLQILQFKYLLDNLKACRKKSPSSKHSRK